jgi:hypothetical protein
MELASPSPPMPRVSPWRRKSLLGALSWAVFWRWPRGRGSQVYFQLALVSHGRRWASWQRRGWLGRQSRHRADNDEVTVQHLYGSADGVILLISRRIIADAQSFILIIRAEDGLDDIDKVQQLFGRIGGVILLISRMHRPSSSSLSSSSYAWAGAHKLRHKAHEGPGPDYSSGGPTGQGL